MNSVSNNPEVRYSRDGDQFHYVWAARRCLRMLLPKNGLTAITIEGSSPQETQGGGSVEAAEQQIDVSEYYGSQALRIATRVRYIQLKHSTQNPTRPWPPSGLKKTIRGFAERYRQLQKIFMECNFTTPVEFCFISNRPVRANFLETIEDAATRNTSRHPGTLEKLEAYTSLSGERLSEFCKVLRLEHEADELLLQRADLGRETNGYLPGIDVDAPVQLMELVRGKALSRHANNPIIEKIDVLRVLGVQEDQIFPAPSHIESSQDAVPRVQETDLVAQIVGANTPVILHAGGGVGKSVLSQRLGLYLPEGSVAVVYDCFGNGEYRRPGSPRHRHKDALVQIANELASLGLCDPLIPLSSADKTDYLRAYAYRLKQCTAAVRGKNRQALVCVVVDAADNAEIAAEEFEGDRSFARDLLRERLPDGVRLVVLCRTERQARLDPPASVLRLELGPFSRDETATFLRKTHTEASGSDVDEFHRLTSRNPRVQVTALGRSNRLPEVLKALGPYPTTVDDTISALLQKTVDDLRDTAGDVGQQQIDVMCSALTVLRPFVPIEVLASAAGVQAATVRSFASDLGRPLLILDDAIQFRDEPVETWFHDHFRPTDEKLSEFIGRLQPLASESAYVASTLPQLMLEAGQLSELINLALSSSLLPSNLIEKRDVELQRLQFALKASLRAERFADAAKLALKAAQETAGNARQRALLRANTDLAAKFLKSDRIQEIVSRREYDDRGGLAQEPTAEKTWIGSHHAYEASLLSYHPDFQGDARSRLRMSYEWLTNWNRLPVEERKREKITDQDIAEISLAHFNIHGPEACAADLRRWKPKHVSYRVGRIVASRLIDQGRSDEIDKFASAAASNVCLLLAINSELRLVRRHAPKNTIERALRLVLSERVHIEESNPLAPEAVLPSITALVESALFYGLHSANELASLLRRYLPDDPPRTLASRFSDRRFFLLRAYALQAAIEGEDLRLIDLAHPELRKRLEEKNSPYDSGEAREFRERVGALLPWHKMWAENLVSLKDAPLIAALIEQTHGAAAKSSTGGRPDTTEEIVEIWFDVLTSRAEIDQSALQQFLAWIDGLRRPLYVPTWTRLARLAVHTPDLMSLAYTFISRAYERMDSAKQDGADSKAETYIALARIMLATDQSEAREYFNRAIEVTSRIGEEIVPRWSAMLDLADRAARPSQPCPKTAYRLARSAERAYHYDDDHFLWDDTVRAIAALCPSSCFAILSRWRDRNFGESKRSIATASNFLLDRRSIDPRTSAALVGFRAHWEYDQFVQLMFAACPSPSDREEVLNHVLRYIRLEDQSSSTWRHLKKLTNQNGLTLPDIDPPFEHTEQQYSFPNRADQRKGDGCAPCDKRSEIHWDSVFQDLALHTPGGLSRAYDNFRRYGPPFYYEEFFSELFNRVPIGEVALVIRAFPDVPEFSEYAFEPFLKQLPEDCKTLLAVQASIGDATGRLCRRYCMKISKDRYWQLGYRPLPLKLASELSGTEEADLVRQVIDAIAKRTEIFGSGRLFTLVGLLASHLSHDEAFEALNFGLDPFDDVLDADDSDGPWTASLEPPADVNEAVAGYIWAALSAPQTSLRWEAAHVVCGLCVLHRQDVLDRLIEHAKDGTGGPFVDSRLHFYHMHARQWLMIAMARAAVENPAALAPYWGFFVYFALESEPHVVIRHFAARAALAVLESGSVDIDEDIVTRLRSVNKSRFPVRSTSRNVSIGGSREGWKKTTRFRFDYDIRRYWFANLGRCFGRNSSDIERQAEKIICDYWGIAESGYGNIDERHQRSIFRDRETWHHQGSYPEADDLDFYVSYHAMMTVAGNLLETVPCQQDVGHDRDEFEEWIGLHLLTRKDGYWLADRRDPEPLERPTWKYERHEGNWPQSVVRSDFARVLGLGKDKLNLSGYWKAISGEREETVRISSALVTPSSSFPLVRALQTARSPHDYRIPDAGDDLEIDAPGFQLKGWIENSGSHTGRDNLDPWAGDIQYPPLRPSKFVRDLFSLKEDRESRVYRIQIEGLQTEVIWSQIWGSERSQESQYYETRGDQGRRLQASHTFLVELLGKVKRDLIVEIQIERGILRHRYERREDGYAGYTPPFHRIFLFRADGRTYSL